MLFILPGAWATSGGVVVMGGGASGLPIVLGIDNTTGGTDLEVTAGDGLLLVENAAVPWTPAATKGCLWVKNDAPNTIWFTDDAGTDMQLGAETLAQTLVLGNVTGGTDLEVSAADALLMVENAAVPWTPAATKGALWVKNDTPNTLWFTDDAGTDVQLGTSHPGDVIGPAGATDDNICAFDGVTGKLIKEGTVTATAVATHLGSTTNPHATTLVLALTSGNTTAGQDLEITAGDSLILGENAATPWTPAAAKGAIWVKNTTPNELWFTDDAGTDFQLGIPAVTDTLAVTLATGNVTGGTDLEVSAADSFLLVENAATPWTPAATKGCIWVKNTTPNELWFTDDAGTDFQLGVAAVTDSLATTLATGNVTGGTDLEVSAADALLLVENAAVPWTPAATKGCIWVKNTTPSELWYTDDAGTDFQIGTAHTGDVVGPAGATDDNIAAFDGVTGKLLKEGTVTATAVANHLASTANPHTVTLPQALVGGGTTGGTDLEVSAADALLFVENAAVPWAPVATKGALWVKSDAPNTLWFTDDAGTDMQIGPPTGAAGGDLGGTYPNPSVDDGADATAIHDDTAAEISAIAPKGAPDAYDYLVIEDAADGDAKKSITIGDLPAASNPNPLADVLAVGGTTGGTDLEVSAADAFLLVENAAVPWAPAATKGAIWVKNDAPNTLWFTDDAGTDVQLGAGGGGGGTALDANVTSENLWCARTNQTPTIDAGNAGQVNLQSESTGGHGTKADYATVGGGLDNLVDNDYSTVCGGQNNDIPDWGAGTHNLIGGGVGNIISHAASDACVIGGGDTNLIDQADHCFVGGGTANDISGTGNDHAVICGGDTNTITGASATHGFIGGGNSNTLSTTGLYAVIVGGTANTISSSGNNDAIVCGNSNDISSNGGGNFIGGGSVNEIATTSQHSVIPGGSNCTITSANFGWAGGRHAKCNHTGTFVWADNTAADVESVAGKEFHIGAQEGIRLSYTTEEDGAMKVVRELATANDTESTLWNLTLGDNTAVYVKTKVVAMQTDGSERACYDQAVLVYRNGGGSVIQGDVQDLVIIESEAAWDCDLDVDTNDVRLRVTGEAGTDINWRATVTYQQVS